MATTTFKPGDRVLVNTPYFSEVTAIEATVLDPAVTEGSDHQRETRVPVQSDARPDGSPLWFRPSELSLITPTYTLTREELEVLDALVWQSPKSDLRDKAITVLASHLNPMVTQAFMVTFERPVDGRAHTEAAIRAVLETQYRNPTTVEETTA